MLIGDLNVPVIGKNVVIGFLVQSHILLATFIIGAVFIVVTVTNEQAPANPGLISSFSDSNIRTE